MTRKEAFEILELPETAGTDDVAKRFDTLFKKYRAMGTVESNLAMKQADQAYRLLSGLEWKDPEADARKKAVRENPNPFWRMIGVDQEKGENWLHYHKWHIVGSVVALALVISFIVSMVTRVPNDYSMMVVGAVYAEDQNKLTEVLKQEVGFKAPMVQFIPLTDTTDGQMRVAYQQKLTVEMMAGENDIMLVDKAIFEAYAAQGAFSPFEERLSALGIAADDARLIQAKSKVEGDVEETHAYGLDVTSSALLKKAGLQSEKTIAVCLYKSKYPDKTNMLIKALMR